LPAILNSETPFGASGGHSVTDEENKQNETMKIIQIKVHGGRIARNPLTGSWFVYIGDKSAADFICESKRDAIATAKERGEG
jgi:hypothetical protein